MQSIDTYIQEKLVINKNSQLFVKEFVFKPKEKDEYAKEINNLKISLPFDIIINNNTHNNKRITISKIEYEYAKGYEFDSWMFYDTNDNYIMGITNNGIRKLLITNEQIKICLYGDENNKAYVTVDSKL